MAVRGREISNVRKERVLAIHQNMPKMSMSEIGRQLGISQQSVSRILRQNKMK